MKAKDVKKITEVKVQKILGDESLSKSEKIRQLFAGGFEIKAIAEAVGVRYNFVYNVVQNHVIMNGIEVEKSERQSKRGEIIALLESGKSLIEVSRETKGNYNYIWKIAKEAGLTGKQQEEVKVKVVEEVKVEAK